jgi:hypothetical protein
MNRPRAIRIGTLLSGTELPLGRRIVLGAISLILASVAWLPSVHFLFGRGSDECMLGTGICDKARGLASRHLDLWTEPEKRAQEIARMRRTNAEWDFMGRTFFVLALAEIALREHRERARCLMIMDSIIDETVRLEQEHGFVFFLMPYGRSNPFLRRPPRSLFVDGEIALMVGARRVIEEKEEYGPLLSRHARAAYDGMRAGPVLCAESYPDECWMFCNTAALAALRIESVLDGRDYSAFFREWIATARERLVEHETGMLVSSFSLDGTIRDGPEGSSIWMSAYCLKLIDDEFACDQYARARSSLGRSFLGFGYAREWPRASAAPAAGWADVDSGPIVPFFQASAGSSGLALLGARAFDDRSYFSSLFASLDLAAFPVEQNGRLRYAASNQVGDAVMLHAMVQGPLWNEISSRAAP